MQQDQTVGQERATGKGHGPSFLRWAGSKRKSLSLLRQEYAGGFAHYVEPFAGSAALFFDLRPPAATLGDANGHLINTLSHVRNDPVGISAELDEIPRTRERYYEVRTRFNQLDPSTREAALLFIYLNRNCFNGLWRTNKRGHFNVPFGGTEMGGNPPESLLQRCASALQKATLKHQDFRTTILDASEPGTLIYADPPYFTATERTFIEYGQKSFGRDDLVDLIKALRVAAERGATVVLTYRDGELLPGIPANWSCSRFSVTRNVGGFRGSRKRQSEVLYSNRSTCAS